MASRGRHPAGMTSIDGQQQPVLRAYRGPPCRIEGCEGVARYGRKGEDAPVCCSQHRTPEMADLTNAICQEPTCVKRAIYGISARRQWCSLHKPAGAVNLNRPKRPGEPPSYYHQPLPPTHTAAIIVIVPPCHATLIDRE